MAEQKQVEKRPQEKFEDEILVRVLGKDISGSKNIHVGLTKIKGVSWTISNIVCLKLGFQKDRKISTLSKDEIQKIEKFLKDMPISDYLKNRRGDVESGLTSHRTGTDLDITKDFDIRRMKKMRSYKGIRHTQGQPVRGQRTRSHFRIRGKAVGAKKGGSKVGNKTENKVDKKKENKVGKKK